MKWIQCYIKRTIFMLRLYEAIRSTLLDRLRYTSYTIVHWINQPIICVIRVQTCIITSNCRCPQVWQHRDGILIPFTTDRSVVHTNDLRIVSCGCIIPKTRGCRKAWLYRSPMCIHCNGQTYMQQHSLTTRHSIFRR